MRSLVDQTDLESAISITLLSKAENANQNGYWADLINDTKCGSLLWVLDRESLSNEVVEQAETFARDSLQWLITGGHASMVDVAASRTGLGQLEIQVTIDDVKVGSYGL